MFIFKENTTLSSRIKEKYPLFKVISIMCLKMSRSYVIYFSLKDSSGFVVIFLILLHARVSASHPNDNSCVNMCRLVNSQRCLTACLTEPSCYMCLNNRELCQKTCGVEDNILGSAIGDKTQLQEVSSDISTLRMQMLLEKRLKELRKEKNTVGKRSHLRRVSRFG